jgi:hypothetical protein
VFSIYLVINQKMYPVVALSPLLLCIRFAGFIQPRKTIIQLETAEA